MTAVPLASELEAYASGTRSKHLTAQVCAILHYATPSCMPGQGIPAHPTWAPMRRRSVLALHLPFPLPNHICLQHVHMLHACFEAPRTT